MNVDFGDESQSQMSSNQFNSTVSKINVEMNLFSYSCRDQISTWLWVYFLFTWVLYLLVILMPMLTCFGLGYLIRLLVRCHLGRSPQSFEGIYEQDETLFQYRFRQLKKSLIHEGKLILFYTVVSLIFELIKGNSIRWMSMVRWLSEASFFPTMVIVRVFNSYIFPDQEDLLDEDPRSIYTIVYLSKAILFVIMRYVEIYPHSTLNDDYISVFYWFCRTFRSH